MSYDISKLYCDFSQVPPGKKLIEHFSELEAFVEFQKCDEQRIKIAILLGDIDSPFVRIKDRDTMLRSIFDFLKIPLKSKADQKFFDSIFHYKDSLTVMAWLRYIQILHETDFTDWLLAKKDYEYFLLKTSEKQSADDSDDKYLARRNKLRETVKKLGQEVREIEAKLFPDSKAAREASLAQAKDKIKLYAEKYSEPYTYI